MAGTSLFALLDDITSLLDDVAILSKVAMKKTTGVLGDDLALNAQQTTGFAAERELPVVWAVAKGSFLNKLILVPSALLISAFVPRMILPLLMLGGLYLCYEGCEKLWHKFAHAAVERSHRAELATALSEPAVDLVALERDRIAGAIRTDFILSAEIVVIALGTMAGAEIVKQVVSLSLIGVGMTVLVYGLVGAIVKLDDLGLRLLTYGGAARSLGSAILVGAPLLMRTLSVAGTVAMFMVGGSIIAHGAPVVEHGVASLVEPIAAPGTLLSSTLTAVADSVVGIAAGAIALMIVAGIQRGIALARR